MKVSNIPMKSVITKIFSLVIIIGLSVIVSCDKDDPSKSKTKCPPYDIVPHSPYEDPIWHPSGGLIGFNHKPIKEILYDNGYDCPHQAVYFYEEDSVGFWLIDSNGTNMRRVLPYTLGAPAWSPDGNWIAFDNNAQIFKMPFDRGKFDTTAITQLTFEGRNFFPAWSPDQQLIAYDNTDCGSATTPIPPNSCGVLVMDVDGNNKRFIAGQSRMPYWDNNPRYLYSFNVKHDLITGDSETFFDAYSNNVITQLSFNPSASLIAFIGNYTNTATRFLKLFSITQKVRISKPFPIPISWAFRGRSKER